MERRGIARPMPRFDLRELAAIFAGGAVGALARAGLLELIPPHPGRWPWATFIVNVAGAFLLGYFATRLQERLPLSAYRRPFLGTGLCGALTTFSTMQVELLRMFDRNEVGLALGYAGASIAAGFAAVLLATAMVRRVRVVA
jgi:CrcB protein